MALNLRDLETAHAAEPMRAPIPEALAAARIADVWRRAGVPGPTHAAFTRLIEARKGPPNGGARAQEQLLVLGHLIAITALGAEATLALQRQPRAPESVLGLLLDRVLPLTAEMVRTNAFRREEFVRCCCLAFGIDVHGETATQSAKRIDQLDYRKALAEAARAESERKKVEAERAEAARIAAEAEAQARGNRE